jgi:hypothetical protein
MPTFEVHIGEMTSFEAPVEPNEPTPEVRDVYWVGDAADPDAAREAGFVAWDEKYGPGKRPISAIVNVKALDDPPTSSGLGATRNALP